jgi:pyruvate-formate lyase
MGTRLRASTRSITSAEPFVLHLAPGVGTFEQFLGGSLSGASADGRRARGPLASDLSPAPIPNDQPATFQTDGKKKEHARRIPLQRSFASYWHKVMMRFGDGGPVANIPEDFPPDRLVEVIRRFADGEGASACAFTVADPETFEKAQRDPASCNLLRVRMGGWTEFFIILFPDHQEQHKRRPLHV